MQFRVTLSENDPIESRICAEARPLNSRRRGEYLRRLLLRGFMAEREDIAKLAGSYDQQLSRNVDLPRDYNKSNADGDSVVRNAVGGDGLNATSIKGIFADQVGPDEATKGGVK